MIRKDSTTISISIERSILKKLDKIAKKSGRTRTGMIEHLVENGIV